MKNLFLILLFFVMQTFNSTCMADELCGSDKELVKHKVNLANYETKKVEGSKQTVFCDKRYNFNKCDEYSVWYNAKELIDYESNGSKVVCSSYGEAAINNKGVVSDKPEIFYYTEKRFVEAAPITVKLYKKY